MSARLILMALCVALVASTAHAQTTTADGVAALARGDVSRAADILRPIAEDWRHNDPDAAFFLGTLYETGGGVPLDPVRACALYNTATASGMFGEPASMLVKKLLFSHDEAWRADCMMTAQIGLDHRFESLSFTVDGEQSVEWTVGGAKVSYKGTSQWFPVPVASRGARFLPLRRRDLRASAAGPAPLHFVQLFVWQPSDTGWALRWHLYEIFRGGLTMATAETVSTSNGAEPPRVDPDALIDLHVNASGLPEVTLKTPAGPRTVAITPQASKIR
jgi:hypothetical protein